MVAKRRRRSRKPRKRKPEKQRELDISSLHAPSADDLQAPSRNPLLAMDGRWPWIAAIIALLAITLLLLPALREGSGIAEPCGGDLSASRVVLSTEALRISAGLLILWSLLFLAANYLLRRSSFLLPSSILSALVFFSLLLGGVLRLALPFYIAASLLGAAFLLLLVIALRKERPGPVFLFQTISLILLSLMLQSLPMYLAGC